MKLIKKFQSLLVELGDKPYYQVLTRELRGCESVLDVGCGSWSPLAKVKKTFYTEGLDIHRSSLEKIKRLKIHDKYRLGDVRKITKLYKPKSFDTVIALDLIEHLSKKEGLRLLGDMEKIARKKVILLTPNGFTKQDPLGGNLHQIHHSGWLSADFQKKGYQVYGMRGLKFIRGECATIRFKPWFFWGLASTLSQPAVYWAPKLAYQLFAVKKLTPSSTPLGSSLG